MIHFLNATGKLTEHKPHIKRIVHTALKKYNAIHTISSLDIVVAENPSRVIPGQGVGGMTETAHEMYIAIDLDDENVKNNITQHLAPIVAHELTHIVRAQAGLPVVPHCRLGDDVVGEGLADHMSLTLYPTQKAPWTQSLAEENFARMKSRFLEHWQEKHYDRMAWIYGAAYADIPYCAGYTLGYEAVRAFLEKTEADIRDQLLVPAEDVVAAWK